MPKILLFSHSGFSDTDANGITMKNLLSAFSPEEKAEFYCDVQSPDFTAARQYFRVTDMQVLKAFTGKRFETVFSFNQSNVREAKENPTKVSSQPRKIPAWLKKYKYNFFNHIRSLFCHHRVFCRMSLCELSCFLF